MFLKPLLAIGVGTNCAVWRIAQPACFHNLQKINDVLFWHTNCSQFQNAEFSPRRYSVSENDNESHDWKHLAEAARDETDPKKFMELIEQLNRALDEHMKESYPVPTEAAN